MRSGAVVCAALVLALATTAFAGDEPPALELLEFEMKDQFDEVHRRSDYDGKVVVVIGSDKEGSQYNGAWGSALADSLEGFHRFEERVSFLAVADVRGVPFFLKGMVKGKFPKEREKWTLVDWKGEFAKEYGWREGVSNVMLFGPSGQRTVHVFGKVPHPDAMAVLVERIRGYLRVMTREELARRRGHPLETTEPE